MSGWYRRQLVDQPAVIISAPFKGGSNDENGHTVTIMAWWGTTKVQYLVPDHLPRAQHLLPLIRSLKCCTPCYCRYSPESLSPAGHVAFCPPRFLRSQFFSRARISATSLASSSDLVPVLSNLTLDGRLLFLFCSEYAGSSMSLRKRRFLPVFSL